MRGAWRACAHRQSHGSALSRSLPRQQPAPRACTSRTQHLLLASPVTHRLVYWAISYFPICFLSQEFSLCSAFRAAKPNPAASPHTHASPCPTDAGSTWSPAADGLPLTDRQETCSPRPFGSRGGLVAPASPQGSERARWGLLGAAAGPALPLRPAGRGRTGLVPCLEMPQHAGDVPWAAPNIRERQILTLLFTCLSCIISYSALGCRPG